MRFIALLCLLTVPLVGAAQVSFDSTADERLEIELVPVVVVGSNTAESILTDMDEAGRLFFDDIFPQFTEMFVATRDALYALGLSPTEYNLHLGNLLQLLVCNEATVFSEQSCRHLELGEISDLPNFVYDLYDGQPPIQGTVQLNVLLLEEQAAWKGTLGVAWRWWWVEDSSQHWSNTACRAWALHSVSVIAHELGHCFRLVHNENDNDYGLDLMVSHYAHFNWVKDSNKSLVQHHFRTPMPLPVSRTDQPLIELHY